MKNLTKLEEALKAELQKARRSKELYNRYLEKADKLTIDILEVENKLLANKYAKT